MGSRVEVEWVTTSHGPFTPEVSDVYRSFARRVPIIAISHAQAVEASRQGIGLIAMKTQSPNYLEGEASIGDAPDHRKALQWVLSKQYVTAAIPGMTTRTQVDLNLQSISSTA